MSKPTPRPLVPFLLAFTLFVLVLIPAPAAAASWNEGGPAAGIFARFWGALSAIWSEEGCVIDGNGGCRDRQALATSPGPTLITANSGCIIDPDGRCRASAVVLSDIGCILDPNGSCRQ
jgi:hypothetical protein